MPGWFINFCLSVMYSRTGIHWCCHVHLHASNNIYLHDSPVLCQQLGVSLDETVSERDLDDLLWVFGCESSAVGLLFFCILSLTASLSIALVVAFSTVFFFFFLFIRS